jgi:SAM-dependent methyltransferase
VGYYPTSWGDAETVLNKCLSLAKGERFLDIGSGNGTFSHVAMEHGFLVTALEPNENSRSIFCEVNGFRPQEQFFDRAFADRMACSYDVALLSQVLEHMTNPIETVRNLYTVLRPGGIVAIAVPHFGSLLSRLQGTKDIFVSPPEHINYFSKRGLKELFLKNGFRLLLIETVSKVPRRRIQCVLRVRVVGAVAWRTIFAAMWLSDCFGWGMVVNAYFEKAAT